MSDKNRILIINSGRVSNDSLSQMAGQIGLESTVCRIDDASEKLLENSHPDAVILALDKISSLQDESVKLLTAQLQKMSVSTLVLTEAIAEQTAAHRRDAAELKKDFLHFSLNESGEMFKGRLAMLLELQPRLRNLQAELDRLRCLDQPVNSLVSQMNEEMRLAAHLQQEFLPRSLPEIPGLRFAQVFRPASWVSGDIYDITRLDEDHIGFYVADVVGHGMPAAILTIFIKRALVTKRITAHHYEIIEPGEALAQLNNDLLEQQLSNFKFATCCYGILSIKSLRLRLASAGHPPPMLIGKDGSIREPQTKGSLLGVFPDQQYQSVEVQLQWGDKLLLYSDGVELAFVNNGPDEPLRFRSEFEYLSRLDIDAMCGKLVEIIESEAGSLHPRDDVTIVGIELTDQPR